MNGFFDKLKDFVGLSDISEADEDYDYIEEEEKMAKPEDEQDKKNQNEEEPRPLRRRYREDSTIGTETVIGTSSRSNVIGMPGISHGVSEVVVIEPHAFEEMPKVIQILKERRSVVLNFNVMDAAEAQRAVDFVAGGTYAIDGHYERIGECIFLFAPSSVKVSTLSGLTAQVSESNDNQAATPLNRFSNSSNWNSEVGKIAQ